MNIFITGIAGFLGSHLADKMLSLGHNVYGNDNLLGGYIDNVNPQATFYQADCRDLESMTNLTKNMDIVIHTAATAHEGLSVFSPSFITKNIFEASVSVISASVQNKVKRFVFCSSMARYGNQPAPFHEEMLPQPVDPYAVAKVASEQVLQILAETHGMEWNIAIPHNIIGPRQRYDDPFRNVLSIMINRNLRGLPAIVYGDGTQTRCFSYIDDCIFCLEKLALDPNIVSQIINIGPDEGTITINELTKIIAHECEYVGQPIYTLDRPREVKHASCSADKARKILGYETKTEIKKAVKATADWIRSKGPKDFNYEFPLEIINEKTPKTWKDRLL